MKLPAPDAAAPARATPLGPDGVATGEGHQLLGKYGAQVVPVPPEATFVAACDIDGALHDPALLTSAQAAYVHAMTVVLLVCAAAALAGGVAAALFLPARAHTGPDSGESTHELARVA